MPRLADQLSARLRAAAPLVGLLFRELALRPAEARRAPENGPVIELLVLLVVWLFVFLRWVLGGRGYE